MGFFSSSFAWGSEVVSVRLGRRTWVGNNGDCKNLMRAAALHIEDPVEISRNVGMPLTTQEAASMRHLCQVAAAALESGGGLAALQMETMEARGEVEASCRVK